MHTGPFEIDFKYGRVAATITEANHMHLDLNGHSNRIEGCGATINNIKYHGGIHVHLWTDGAWHIGPEYQSPSRKGDEPRRSTGYELQRSAYVKRVDTAGLKWDKQDITEAGYNKLKAALEPAVNEWYRIVEPSGVFQIAQRRMLHRALNDLIKKQHEASEAYNNATIAVNAAREILEAAGGPVPIEEE